ncbi:N-formylglutamate amidohydrolase [uncultured Erythrobacter sp.]|uniref:N-formylglutamate amidohydrolase n=1 Tax=uncultured Erythrobacter sp. TaxID=263913 RepID=UPI00261D35DE|nr:N-formylglutamate amidohydrolase [uncultured Erythrobacter sp.]
MTLPYRQIGEATCGGIVCVSDHASNQVPEGIDLRIDPALVNEHIGVDIGVEGIAEEMAANHGVPAHLATVSRLVVDLHREEEHPGVVPQTSDGHVIHGNVGADVEERLSSIYRPYHEAMSKWLDERAPSLIISLHSFTPKLATSDEPRPWEVALLYNEDDRAARHAIQLFVEEGLNVGDNEPYSGKQLNATMNRHAEPFGRPYCAIEIRQDLISTTEDQNHWAALLAKVSTRVALALD